MTGEPDDSEAIVAHDPAPDATDSRALRLNEAAIGDVRREVSAAVSEIDGALVRLREVLDSRLTELRLPDSDTDIETPEGGAS